MLSFETCKFVTASSVFTTLASHNAEQLKEDFSDACATSYGDANRTMITPERFEETLAQTSVWLQIAAAWEQVKEDMEVAGAGYIDLEN